MIANALLITIAFLLAYGFWLMGELKFMAPYKAVLLHAYGEWICVSIADLVFQRIRRRPAAAAKISFEEHGPQAFPPRSGSSKSGRSRCPRRPKTRSLSDMSRDPFPE